MAVDIEQYMVDLKGNQFVKYAGLLALAHEKGLKRISTEVRQLPTPENGNLAVMHALVEMEDGRTFAGIGDSSPQSVSRNMVPHLLRHSETRAKARALRDAVNVGVAALEELGEDVDSTPAPVTPLREAQQQASQASKPQQAKPGRDLPATRKQLNYLEALIVDAVDGGVPGFEEKVAKPLSELTRAEASEWVGKLSGKTG